MHCGSVPQIWTSLQIMSKLKSGLPILDRSHLWRSCVQLSQFTYCSLTHYEIAYQNLQPWLTIANSLPKCNSAAEIATSSALIPGLYISVIGWTPSITLLYTKTTLPVSDGNPDCYLHDNRCSSRVQIWCWLAWISWKGFAINHCQALSLLCRKVWAAWLSLPEHGLR